MFLFKASRYLEELEKHRTDIYAACKKAMEATIPDMEFIRVDKDEFKACPDESIDYAVMEKTDSAMMVPMDAGWNDVGSWSSLWEVTDKDNNGNAIQGDVLTEQTKNSYIYSENKLVATVGV